MRNIISHTLLAASFPLFSTLFGLGCEAGVPIAGPADSAPSAADPSGNPQANPPGDPPQNTNSGGAVTVHLVDGPTTTYTAVNVEILKVELCDAQGACQTIAEPNQTVDLLKLQSGASALLGSQSFDPGSYSGLRLLVGASSSLLLSDGSSQALKIPSGQQSGIKIDLNFDLASGDTKDVYIDFDVAQSVHVVKTGQSDRYLLRPVLHASVLQGSGTISGHLTDATSGMPMAGADVYAESRDGQGQPAIVRHVIADSAGKYNLDLLPFGAAYFVVATAPQSGAAYLPAQSQSFALDASAPNASFDGALTPAATTGAIAATLQPMAADGDADTCQLLAGAAGQQAILAEVPTSQDATEQAQWSGVPSGDYSVRCLRRTTSDTGAVTTTASNAQPVSIAARSTGTVTLTF